MSRNFNKGGCAPLSPLEITPGHTPYTPNAHTPFEMLAIQSPMLQSAVHYGDCYGKNEIGRLNNCKMNSKHQHIVTTACFKNRCTFLYALGRIACSRGWIWPWGRRLATPALHCRNGGLVFDQSPTDISKMYHHGFPVVANKSQPYCREKS